MATQLKKIKDQVMVITGATSGIGLVTTRMAAEKGARLVLAGRSKEALHVLAEEITRGGGEAVYSVGDVGSFEEVREIARAAAKAFGGFDTWVNNAGVSIYGKTQDVPLEDMRRLFETNFWGLVHGSLVAAEHLKQKGGALINIGSTLSERAIPLQGIYCASKHAVKGFTDALRMELEADGAPVSVTLVKPGAIDTPYPHHAKNYLETEPQHVPPVYAPEVVAETILHCAETPVRDVFAGGGGKFLASFGQNAPRLADKYMESAVISGTKSGKPPRPREENGLDHAAGALEERGGHEGHVMELSLYTKASMHPVLTVAAAVGAGAAGVAVWRALKKNGSDGDGEGSVSEQNPQIAAANLPDDKSTGRLEQVMAFHGSMPTGVTVSDDGRIFVNYPRWGDPVPFTVAEIVNGQEVAFPNEEINRLNLDRTGETFVSVQSVVVDPKNRLWILDTGAPNLDPIVAQDAPKLVGIDLQTNQIFKTIHFPADVVLQTTYLNDIRFDLRKGEGGVAYITDSSDKGANGIIVVDLGSGKSRRRFNDHPSTKAEENFLPFVEGAPLMKREAGKPAEHIKIGADGIAISADGERLFYCPLASRRLFSVSTAALLGEAINEEEVAATVRDEGMKPASDGLETDAEGNIYCTAYEANGIVRRSADGSFETIIHDDRVLWADTMSVAADGYLYFTANQLHRQPNYNNGTDKREKPYSLFRVRINAAPVRLR
jgi:short-subunit dehydrogenase/sugar lactone lactonase YvrE